MPDIRISQDPNATEATGPRAIVRPVRRLNARFSDYLKAVAGARFDVSRKVHLARVDNLPPILTRLREASLSVELDDEVKKLLEAHDATRWLDQQATRSRLAALEAELAKEGKNIRGYQREAIEWLSSRSTGLLADPPGAGKTLTSLLSLASGAPMLVVCPASVKGVWVNEIRKWRKGPSVSVLEGRESFRWPRPEEIVVTNYDILPSPHDKSCKRVIENPCPGCSPFVVGAHKPECPRGRTFCKGCGLELAKLGMPEENTCYVADEAHLLKNPKARRTESSRAVKERVLAKKGRVYFLTGTPIMSDPFELWSVLEGADLAYEAFGSFKEFLRIFHGKPKKIERRVKGKTVTITSGYTWGTPEPEVADLLRRVMLRRDRKDILGELPPRTRQIVPVKVDKKALRACDEFLEAVGGADKIEKLLTMLADKAAAAREEGEKSGIPFELMAKARAALAAAKIPALLERVEAYEEMGEPLIVFSAHRAPIDALEKRPGWKVITGSAKGAKARTEAIELFQAGELKGIGLTIQAGGTGITLTRGAYMLFVDEAWTPAENEQASDRNYRIGQTRGCLMEILTCNHPLDERVAEVLGHKRGLIASSIDVAASRNTTESDMGESQMGV